VTVEVTSKRTRMSLLKFVNRQQNKQNNVVHTFYLDFSKSSAFWSDSKKKKEKKMDYRNHRLRVQNKKPIKRSGKKPLVKKFLDYLKSDTFLYAPLLSPQPSGFPSPNNFKGFKLKLTLHFLFTFIACTFYGVLICL